jgi:transposase
LVYSVHYSWIGIFFEGKTHAEIAEEMNLSVKSINRYKQKTMEDGYVKPQKTTKEIQVEINEVYNERAESLNSLTDEALENLYNQISDEINAKYTTEIQLQKLDDYEMEYMGINDKIEYYENEKKKLYNIIYPNEEISVKNNSSKTINNRDYDLMRLKELNAILIQLHKQFADPGDILDVEEQILTIKSRINSYQ